MCLHAEILGLESPDFVSFVHESSWYTFCTCDGYFNFGIARVVDMISTVSSTCMMRYWCLSLVVFFFFFFSRDYYVTTIARENKIMCARNFKDDETTISDKLTFERFNIPAHVKKKIRNYLLHNPWSRRNRTESNE